MGKGTSRLQNVQLLKWCSELGVRVTWNLLYGFPGESPDEYASTADLMPSLYHLPPPTGAARIRLDRFGPYWKAPGKFDLVNVRHWWSYDFVFAGLPATERARLAYFFECDYGDGRDPASYTRGVEQRAGEWRRAVRARATLELRTTDAGAFVFDTRPCRVEEMYPLSPEALTLVRVLDGFRGRAGLVEAMRQQGADVDDASCERLLDEFRRRRFIVEEGDVYLSVIVDPAERQRVAERRLSLRVRHLGFDWPKDFPDPAQQQVVRVAILGLGQKSAHASSV
jgi:hypothetical protein